ncbi:MAG: FAD-dependent oxidoreductase [Armatimonadetes bacterium]|nr:FAD-dependent oxidoreductase [Armatimonadota bacterium]
MSNHFDVAVIGGGPGGTTVASMLRTHAPNLSVVLLEREKFPREHIGESLLPTIGRILDEINAWDKVEAGGFPIKIGATYKWGCSDELWDFNLLETAEVIEDEPRPGKYGTWRGRAAWQVDRAKFDKILLDHAESLGCQVREATGVTKVETEGDKVTGLVTSSGDLVTADYYVDASGSAAIIRKAMNVEVEEPPQLRNIAIWDHWDDAEWAVSIGKGGTRVQVMSLGYGWIWFIPISPTRTSIGLICPADYYKETGLRPADLYIKSVMSEPRISSLVANAKQLGEVKATKDWSFAAKRTVGENWFLVGESAGFADPILAAGITMTMVGAKECAYTIAELARGELDAAWMKTTYHDRQAQRVLQHIRFANFWYTGNGHFSDLVDYTGEIAKEAGMNMDAKSAWQWLGTGGFVSLETAGAGLAGHSIEQIKNIQSMFFQEESEWLITKVNVFDLNMDDVVADKSPQYENGRIKVGRVLCKGETKLPLTGGFRVIFEILQRETTLGGIIKMLRQYSAQYGPVAALSGLESLEVLLKEGWVTGSVDKSAPLLKPEDIPRTPNIDWNKDFIDPKVQIASVIEG